MIADRLRRRIFCPRMRGRVAGERNFARLAKNTECGQQTRALGGGCSLRPLVQIWRYWAHRRQHQALLDLGWAYLLRFEENHVDRHALSALAGASVFVLQFRRPLMCIYSDVFLSSSDRIHWLGRLAAVAPEFLRGLVLHVAGSPCQGLSGLIAIGQGIQDSRSAPVFRVGCDLQQALPEVHIHSVLAKSELLWNTPQLCAGAVSLFESLPAIRSGSGAGGCTG